MAVRSAEQLSARERLLAAANELFYEEGVNTVGIDRVIERAGVAKATLYSAFGSKDELIRAYLEQRYQARRERTMRAVEKFETPRERLMAVFDTLSESLSQPNYHGCAFVNASAEARPGSPIERAVDGYRGCCAGCSRSWPGRPARPIRSGSPGSCTCSTTGRACRRAWTTTPARPFPRDWRLRR